MKLTGSCNKCGLCCIVGNYRCQFLIISGKPGTAQATTCGVYEQRYDGMPIMLMDKSGNVIGGALCGKDSKEEMLAILQRGIGKGCSLVLEEEIVENS